MHPVEISRPHSGRCSWQIGLLGAAGWMLGKHVVAVLAQQEIINSDERGGGQFFYTPDRWAPGSGQSRGSNTGAYARKLLFDTPTSTGARLAVEWLKPWAANTAIALGSVGNEGTSDQFILNNNFQSTVLNPFNTAVLSDGSPATEGPRCCRSGTRERFADSRWRKPYGFRYAVILPD
jgi:hypothetical protein